MKNDKELKRKVRQSYAVSTISIALVLFLLGTVGYLISTVISATKIIGDSIPATVELAKSVDSLQKVNIHTALNQYDVVNEVKYLSREDKAQDEEFRSYFGEDFEKVLGGENPLSDSFEISISAQAQDSPEMKEFASDVKNLPGVVSVSYPTSLADKVYSTLSNVQTVLLFFGASLLVISLILLNNTIRLAIYSRRYMINTMKLVGATKWFIMKPFLWSSAKCGAGAGAIASILFLGLVYALGSAIPEIINLYNINTISIIIGGIFIIGITISLFFTIFAVNKFVNMKSNKIHIY